MSDNCGPCGCRGCWDDEEKCQHDKRSGTIGTAIGLVGGTIICLMVGFLPDQLLFSTTTIISITAILGSLSYWFGNYLCAIVAMAGALISVFCICIL